MTRIKLNKSQKRNPFYDKFKTKSQIEGLGRPHKGRSSKKDKYKNKNDREFNW